MEGVVLTKYVLIVYEMPKNDRVHKLKKLKKKIKMMTMSKPHAHLQTINKTFAKFQKEWNEIVGGVALTKYSLIDLEAGC